MRDYQTVINILGEVGGHVKTRFKFDKTFNEKRRFKLIKSFCF